MISSIEAFLQFYIVPYNIDHLVKKKLDRHVLIIIATATVSEGTTRPSEPLQTFMSYKLTDERCNAKRRCDYIDFKDLGRQ